VLDVAERSGLSFRVISEAAIRLKGAGLLADLGEAAR
jgi:aminopeptidase-like protein